LRFFLLFLYAFLKPPSPQKNNLIPSEILPLVKVLHEIWLRTKMAKLTKKTTETGKIGGIFLLCFALFLFCPSISVSDGGNKAQPAIYAHVSHAPALDLTQAYAYPVPYRPSRDHNGVTFINLSSEATIRIYTLDGQLVKTLLEEDGDGILRWNGTNEEGSPLASDVYVYSIENGVQIKLGKLLLIQ
jgi:hypothetical protein